MAYAKRSEDPTVSMLIKEQLASAGPAEAERIAVRVNRNVPTWIWARHPTMKVPLQSTANRVFRHLRLALKVNS